MKLIKLESGGIVQVSSLKPSEGWCGCFRTEISCFQFATI